MERIKHDFDFLVERGHEVVGVFLQGSQNYNLDYEDSDIDTKAIIIPCFKDFLFNKKQVSTTIELDITREHIDVKDIKLMFENIKKQNINFVEILFTEYYYLNPKYEEFFQPMFDNRERIARYDQLRAISAMYGMACEKRKALIHRYPTTEWKIDKFGYDPKQLHHIIRLVDFQLQYVCGRNYSDILKYEGSERDRMIDIKSGKGGFTVDSAMAEAEYCVTKMKSVIENTKTMLCYDTIDTEMDSIFEEVMTNIFTLRFKDELNNN